VTGGVVCGLYCEEEFILIPPQPPPSPGTSTPTMSSVKFSSLIGYNNNNTAGSSRKHLSISIPPTSATEVMSPHIKSVDELRVLGINLSHFNAPTQFLISVAGVFVFYLIYGCLQVGMGWRETMAFAIF